MTRAHHQVACGLDATGWMRRILRQQYTYWEDVQCSILQ